MMKNALPLLFCLLLAASGSAFAAPPPEQKGEAKNCRTHGGKAECEGGSSWCKSGEGTCSPERRRGQCGKRRGDWYGASQPVATAADARVLLRNYFSGQGYTVSDVVEKRWGFKAEIVDKDGTVVDRVMIDKRTGRIRSLY